MSEITALGLYSGGLDSLLACRVIAAQGIRVIALKFVTPFFDHDLLTREEEFQREVMRKHGVDVRLVDLSEGYIELLRNPAHGYGKHFNPCIDCKIFMLTRARELMPRYDASFLFTGEVLGQRPMSQRRDTLRVIERDSKCEDILLRPLCAKRLDPTRPEREGMVDREKLYGFSGRGRKDQMALAREFGITEYPAPAGGCILTDPNLGARIERFYQGHFATGRESIEVGDIKLLQVGRQFLLPGGTWLVLGRKQAENERIKKLYEPGDWLLKMEDRPGPTGLLRRAEQTVAGTEQEEEILRLAAGLVVRYGKKIHGETPPATVRIYGEGKEETMTAHPVDGTDFAC
ncbi:tRNA 4-thiouridine(8) synthase ThiI [Desulfolithobacter dissulfuricans]|uniref:tRNA 4-thiouridine(8) synthase ThiI n=1 Tax=Desulfolithobacter dissulfuricans TaxID=2795293 RepID=A0A915UA85_9BACT|nr:thiamine biosynthesis protein [Desulfolithobacter dissulfuricans]BCO09711.1 tRNA 4-thiouridine(8) synthase ThiI [Desulfolithobacter dissulfuricans]